MRLKLPARHSLGRHGKAAAAPRISRERRRLSSLIGSFLPRLSFQDFHKLLARYRLFFVEVLRELVELGAALRQYFQRFVVLGLDYLGDPAVYLGLGFGRALTISETWRSISVWVSGEHCA